MESRNTRRPSVPGRSSVPGQGGGWKRQRLEGAKNHRVGPGRQGKRRLYIATYNTRTLSSDEKMLELEEELKQIHWDVLGMSEIRKRGEQQSLLKSGNMYYHRCSENSSVGGVGLLIHKRHVQNLVQISSVSPRVCFAILKLNQRYNIKIIQAYAPTSQHTDEDVENFYDEVTQAMSTFPTYFTVLAGDFNAKLGKKQTEEETSLGCHGIGERNERGHLLLQFLLHHQLAAMNTFFKKPEHRKWTWVSPDSRTRNEIDFIITDKKQIIADVTVLNRLSIGSDHRMVRAKVLLNLRTERSKLVNNNGRERWTGVDDVEGYQRTIRENLEDADESDLENLNRNIVDSINAAQKKYCSRQTENQDKLSNNTKNLMKQRRKLLGKYPRHKDELRDLNRDITKAIRADIRNYNNKWVTKVIEDNKGMRVLRSKLGGGRAEITGLEDERGQITNDREKILRIVEDFYTKLYKNQTRVETSESIPHILNQGSETMPTIIEGEVLKSLSEMKNNRAPGEDNVVVEAIRLGGKEILKAVTKLFNKCLEEGTTPQMWNNAIIVIMHKKGSIANLQNYRPISLLTHLYKLFTKIITARLTNKFDLYQPREQAGFRAGYGTNDHLQVMKSLIEKSVEYNKPLVLTFVDYEKAFDSINHHELFKALADCRIDHRYISLLRHIYKNATAKVKVHAETNRFKIEKGVRQGDTISPKLFTTLMECMFKNIKLDNKGISVDGEKLHHLRFADDIVLISDRLDEANEMLLDLSAASQKVGLKINITKTQFMTNLVPSCNLILEGKEIQYVTSYKYLGHEIRLTRDNQTCELNRRIGLTWAAFGRLRHVFKSDIPMCLKRKVFDQCVLPVLTYGSETLTLTQKTVNKIRTAQRAMERSMLGVTLRDKIRNEELRRRTRVADAIEKITHLKWSWAGHIARMSDDRWTKKILEWRPRDEEAHRNRGRPPTRWTDDLKRISSNWIQDAQDRTKWFRLREAYVQQWTRQAAI